MAIAHDALTARHPLAIEAIEGVDLKGVSAFEEDGNWLVAGEEYSRLETRQPATDLRARAQLLVRSATCLDIAGQHFPAARAYSNAAGVLHALQEWQAAGELRSRGARLYLRGGHPFLAGTEWMAAAREFGMLGNTSIRSVDNIPPVPAGAAGNTIAGRCLEEAGRAFLTCPGTEAKWACGAFWSAAEHYERTFPSPNIQTFEAYREALAAGIKQYGSLAPEDTRRYLPLREEQRLAKVDALDIMESALRRSHEVHSKLNPHVGRVETTKQIDQEMIETLHSFSLSFGQLGLNTEASKFRVRANFQREKAAWNAGRYGSWALFRFWRLTSKYGESLVRWALSTIIVVVSFAGAFALTNSVEPASTLFDYIYFSVFTFTSLGYGDIQPVGPTGKVLACIEIVSGFVSLGVLLSFVSARVSRA